VLVVAGVTPAIGLADSAAPPTRWQQLGSDVRLSLRNSVSFVAAPASFSQAQAAAAFCLVVLDAGLALEGDQRVQTYVTDHHSTTVQRALDPWQYYGAWWFSGAVAAGAYGLGWGLGNEGLRETGRQAVTALGLAALLTGALKVAVGRSRPTTREGPQSASPFSFSDNNWSFPSGQTTAAFALSTTLACRSHRAWVAAALYAAALLTAVQRVYSDEHWCSDAIAGAAIGTAAGLSVSLHSRPGQRAGRFGMQVVPSQVTSGAQGCALWLQW
jgi:membrane-associated phospholipid phosphatase